MWSRLTISEEQEASRRGGAYTNLQRLAGHAIAEESCMCKGTHACCGRVVLEEKRITTSLWVNRENRCIYSCEPKVFLSVPTYDEILPTHNFIQN